MCAAPVPRGLTFGLAAESYERYRPGYPDEVVDRTLAFAGGSVSTAVEVGAGTGKATHAFASRGVAVTALEPDPDMCAVLRRETTGLDVTPVESSFEDFGSPRTFDLLFSAASWHWTDPVTRWDRTARLVPAGGTVALFGAPLRIADDGVREAVDEVRRPLVPDEDELGGPASGDLWWPGTELLESAQFTDVRQEVVPRSITVAAGEYAGYLSTVSAYLQVPVRIREQVLRAIVKVLPPQVRLDAAVRLHLARRVG
jgi:SAM-dependent methyltransferase